MNLLKNKDQLMKNLLLDFPSSSRYAESFRTLRTSLNFSDMEKELKSVLVTSSVESEGKTNTVINLGYTIALSGKKVLIIDTDLRRPHMTEVFSLKKSNGFTDILSTTFSHRISSGDLADYAIGDLVQLTHLQKRTGELTITADNKNTVTIFFVSGKIVDVYWKNRPETKKLANVLVQKKLLTKEKALLALNQQKKSVQRLGTILFNMGLVSKENLSKELAVHTVETMRIISFFTGGKFQFSDLSPDDVRFTVSGNVNFEKLFKEFLGPGQAPRFISQTIKASIHPTKAKNLYILPSGKIPPNPSEVIGSSGAAFLLDLLKKKYDFIILDSPPVMPTTDALLMAPRTDGTLLVVKSGNTESKVVKSVVDSFKAAKLPILGILLNQVDLKKEGYYRYYKKYSSAYYGK